MIAALLLAAGLVSTESEIRTSRKGIETPIRTIKLTDIRAAQKKSTVPLVVGTRTLNLSISFGNDYLQYLTVEEGAIKSFDWNELKQGVFFHGITLKTDGRSVVALPPFLGREVEAPKAPGRDGAVAVNDLFRAAYDSALTITVPQVKYAVVLSPDNKFFGMLRRDDAGKFFIGVHAIQKLQTQTVWFVGVNGIIYGVKQHDDLITVVKKAIDVQ